LALGYGADLPEFDADRFNNFSITHELVEKFTAVYWQIERTEKISKKTIDEIYKWMKDFREKNKSAIESAQAIYVKNFNQIFHEREFDALLDQKNCYYCGITIDDVVILAQKRKIYKKNERGWTLEIDRKNSNLEYFPSNCVMSCYWCNNAKTDEFTAEEFKRIVGKAIAQVWHERLRDSNIIGDFSHLTFLK